jgi:hypothetical protein
VALYNSDRVIVERVEGEPAPARMSGNLKLFLAISIIVVLAAFLTVALQWLGIAPYEKFTVVKEAGCDLRVMSSFNRYQPDSNTRVIEHRIFNAGPSCVVKSDQLDPKGPLTIGAGDTVTRQRLAQSRPKLVQAECLLEPRIHRFRKRSFHSLLSHSSLLAVDKGDRLLWRSRN